MEKIGYSVIELSSNNELAHSRSLPIKLSDPANPHGRLASFDKVGQEAPAGTPLYKLVERWEVSRPSDDYLKGAQLISFDGTKIIVDYIWTFRGIQSSSFRMKKRIKTKAKDTILASYPDWKQRNMTAEGVSLLDSYRLNGSWTAEEQTRSDELNAIWASVKALRVHSGVLEAEIDVIVAGAGTDEEKGTLINDWVDHDWPAVV